MPRVRQELRKLYPRFLAVTSCSVSLLTNSMGVEGAAADEQIIKAVTDGDMVQA